MLLSYINNLSFTSLIQIEACKDFPHISKRYNVQRLYLVIALFKLPWVWPHVVLFLQQLDHIQAEDGKEMISRL